MLAGIFHGAGLALPQAWSATGAVFGAVAILTTLITTLSVRERPELAGEPSRLPAFKAMRTCFKNRPFVSDDHMFLSSSSFTVWRWCPRHPVSAGHGRQVCSSSW
jgi:Na+/melibiose symporter-like transporter